MFASLVLLHVQPALALCSQPAARHYTLGLERDRESDEASALRHFAAAACDEHAAALDAVAARCEWVARAPSAEIGALACSVLARGGYIGPVRCGVNADGVRGLFATADVAPGMPLLAVPSACTLCAAASGSGVDSAVADGHGAAGLGTATHEALMVELLRARAAASTADVATAGHARYLAALPETVELLRDWSAEELAALRCDELAARARTQREWAQRTVASVSKACEAMGVPCDDAAVEWAERIVRSRAVQDSDAASGARALRLVPLLDLANHRGAEVAAAEPPVAPILHMADGMIALCATGPLKRGDEVTFAYREGMYAHMCTPSCVCHAHGMHTQVTFAYREGITDAELLLDYGFAERVRRGEAMPPAPPR